MSLWRGRRMLCAFSVAGARGARVLCRSGVTAATLALLHGAVLGVFGGACDFFAPYKKIFGRTASRFFFDNVLEGSRAVILS